MRIRSLVPAVAIAAALLCGCGDRRLILNVDVLSYMDAGERTFPVAAVPGVDVTATVVDDQAISMFEGLGDVAGIESVSLGIGAIGVDSTGSGTVAVKLYLADEGTDPLTTPPVLDQTLTFAPGQSDTLSATVDGDARIRDLFSHRQMRVSVTAGTHVTSPGPMTGHVTLTRLDAVVICKRSQ